MCADAQDTRRTLSDAILQGLSADPELLLTRLDVLGPATMIEEVFIEREDGRAAYTSFGSSHLQLLSKYRELIAGLAAQLREDASHVDPARGLYSPFGVIYGFCADILSNMAIRRLVSQDPSALTLEDMFSSDGSLAGKLSKAREWEALPRHSAERARFEHSTEWAAQIFSRLMIAFVSVDLVQEVSHQTGRPPGRQQPGRCPRDHWVQVLEHDHDDEFPGLGFCVDRAVVERVHRAAGPERRLQLAAGSGQTAKSH